MEYLEYLSFDKLDDLAKKEKIYYSPTCGIDKISSKKFCENKQNELNLILKKIKAKEYKFSAYQIKLINKGPNKKPRITCVPTIRDRLVITSIKSFLYDNYDNEKINVPANQIVKEIIEIKKIKKYDAFIKLDLSAFFDSIEHETLISLISTHVTDEYVLQLIRQILENPQKYTENSPKEKNVVGVPQGLSISTVLANLYLKDFDFKYDQMNNLKYYRYVDDIIIFCSKNELENILKKIRVELKIKYGLYLNEEKLEKGDINASFEYLGYKFENDKITVRENSRINFEKNLEIVFHNFSKLPNKKDERQIKKFLWIINSKITGIVTEENKRYGWLYYFSCINDIVLLKRMDGLIKKFIERFKLADIINIDNIKSFEKSYYQIKYNFTNSQYLLKLNEFTLEKEVEFLETVCGIDVSKSGIKGEELERKFKYNFYRTLKSLEKDIDSIS